MTPLRTLCSLRRPDRSKALPLSVICQLLMVFLGAGVAAHASSDNLLPSMHEFEKVSTDGRTVFGLLIDNDSLLLKKEDGFYTSGNQLSFGKALTTSSQSITYGARIGQDLYTASDIKLRPEQISSTDHPYAGWLYGGVFRETSDASGQGSRLSLDIGCLGACAGGEWTQNHLHRLLNQPLPQAWSTQLQQEWGAVLAAVWSPSRWVLNQNLDVSPRLKARLGNIFTDASLDVTARLGQLSQLPLQPASYVFLRGEMKVVGYNATLQGGYFANQSLAIGPRRSVGEMELGYQWQSASYGLSASVVRRSSEINELSHSVGAQNFARLNFHYAM